jgi:hypothetical protein
MTPTLLCAMASRPSRLLYRANSSSALREPAASMAARSDGRSGVYNQMLTSSVWPRTHW